MDAVDTNLVVRLVTDDNPTQSRRARVVFAAKSVFVAKTVLLESEWVLRYSYGLDRDAIARALRAVLGLPNVIAERDDQLARAMTWYESGLDFADALHLASGDATQRFHTFDRQLAKRSQSLGGPQVVAA